MKRFSVFLHMFVYIRVSLDVRDYVIISMCNKVKQSVDPSMTRLLFGELVSGQAGNVEHPSGQRRLVLLLVRL